MSRKKDVLLVFNFLIDLLKETATDISPMKSEPKIEEKPKEKESTKIDNFKALIDAENVRNLMHRVDEMDKKSTFISPIFGDLQRNFESDLKKMSTQIDVLTKEKEKNDRNIDLDATAKRDFDVIKALRKQVKTEGSPSYLNKGFNLESGFTNVSKNVIDENPEPPLNAPFSD